MSARLRFGLAILMCLAQARAADEKPNMRATAVLALRATPPQGLLNSSGKQIGTIAKGATVVARECLVVKDLFGSYLWYRVEIPAAEGKAKQAGWVYAGNPGGSSYLQALPGASAPVCH
jgi:hypothetical protein